MSAGRRDAGAAKGEFPCVEPARDFTAAADGAPGKSRVLLIGVRQFGAAGAISWGGLGGSEFQPLEIMAHGLAIALAAGHRGAARHYQDEVAARGAADLLHVAHVDEAGAADAQHRLRLKGLLRLLQRAAGVKGFAPDRE